MGQEFSIKIKGSYPPAMKHPASKILVGLPDNCLVPATTRASASIRQSAGGTEDTHTRPAETGPHICPLSLADQRYDCWVSGRRAGTQGYLTSCPPHHSQTRPRHKVTL